MYAQFTFVTQHGPLSAYRTGNGTSEIHFNGRKIDTYYGPQFGVLPVLDEWKQCIDNGDYVPFGGEPVADEPTTPIEEYGLMGTR